MQPSKYQQKIYDFILNRKGNAVVSAVAGSGKTTTLVNSLKMIPSEKKVLFLAFNKSIAEELKQRVPNLPNVTVKTVHSYGYSSMSKDMKPRIEDKKYKKLLNAINEWLVVGMKKSLEKYSFTQKEMELIDKFEFTKEENVEVVDKTSYFNRVLKLADLGRLNLIDINTEMGISQLEELSVKHNIDTINGETYRAWLLIKIGNTITNEIDFTDMVYLPIYLKLRTWQYDFVFIDECQDLNACQRELMQKAIKPKYGRFIAVGDPAQAIYGFAGADSESFNKLKQIYNTIELPLSVCYRCGTDIIDKAKTIMPHIEASPSAKKGLVADSCSFEQVTDSDMVLCRNTMPLVKLCMIYLRKGIKAYVMGTDISSGLISLIEAQKRKTEEFSCENIINRLYGEKDKIIRNLIKKEKITISEAEEHPKVIAFTDKLQTIETIAEGVQEGEVLIEKLKELFSENKEGICLSTVHKSKGLEADKVYIIHSELMPSKYAKKDWEKQQERNLMYVAYTRAKSLLGFITDFDAYADYNPKEYVEKEEKTTEYVGVVGEKSTLTLTLVELRDLNTSFGDTTLFKMIDEKGNLFEKMGTIPERFIISNHDKVVEGTIVQFSGTIKAHKEFNGQKINVISTLAKI